MTTTRPSKPQPGSEWIVGGGEMGRLIRAMNWSHTPLGPIASWPQSLRTTVNLCLASDLPICIIWGPELVQIYNDGYRVICGEKHPRSMGQNFPECWREAWPVIGAAHDAALAGDTAFLENQHIFLERHGYMEECFFTFSFSPIRDETGHLAGLFHPVIETTPRMLGERRTRTLRDLANRTSNAKTIEEAFRLSTEMLSEYPLDLPFLLIYRLDETQQQACLVAATGLVPGMKGAPEIVPLYAPDNATWPLGDVFRAGVAMPVDDVAARFGSFAAGPFPESIASVVFLPIMTPGAERPTAVVIAGCSPRLKSNEMYRGFHDLLSGAITTAVASADAYDAARNRTEALAEIDRAKTEFFSNVSHEFRTPLTLMLGPLEDALGDEQSPLSGVQQERLKTAHRNSLRLLKLVNSLLDFSRIEAGRGQASLQAVDLATSTAELASSFRSAIERAGLTYDVACEPLSYPVHVDPDMWEKIVLNLLSNAFKFTFEGAIAVRLRSTPDGRAAELIVRDSGVGVPANEIPRLFERFHRIEGQKSRSFEGSGIGLALVRELVQQHGGTVSAESAVGEGTTFTVTIPFGAANRPAQPIATGTSSSALASRAGAYVEEALRWLPEGPEEASGMTEDVRGLPHPADASAQAHVLLADDNADMREYLRRLLESRWSVETVSDGQAALEAIRRRKPDLLLTDVMMPRLDGFGLLREVRADPALIDLPVLLLSARAGEEARVEGLEAGADDYLTKPFSARELLARVAANLTLARVRRETVRSLADSEARLRRQLQQMPGFVAVLSGSEHIFEYVNDAYVKISGPRDFVGRSAREVFPELDGQDFFELLDQVFASGVAYSASAVPLQLEGDEVGRFINIHYEPTRAEDGSIIGIFVGGYDVTEKVRNEAKLRELNETLETRVLERTAELERAQQALRQAQKMEALGQLAGGIAHDFNNVLQAVSGGLSLIQKRASNTDEVRKLARMAADASHRGAAITGRLLSFARRGELQPSAINPTSLLEGLRELLIPTLGIGIEIVLEVEESAPLLLADKAQLDTVIINLAVNARDAMASGGRITIRVAPVSFHAGGAPSPALSEGDYLQIDLTDTGPGMDAATLRRAAEPFFTTKPTGQGTGLGLSMSRGFAEQSGGALAIWSEPGKGTRVTLWFPQARGSAGTAAVPEHSPSEAHPPARALVVDDDPMVREILGEQLKSIGYEVKLATDGLDALNQLDTGTVVDVLVTDYSMPGMNGVVLIEEARRRLPNLPAVLLTGFADGALRLTSGKEQARFTALLRKPVNEVELAERLEALLLAAPL